MKKLLLISGAGVAAVALAGFAAWYFLFRSDAPPEVSLEGALASRSPTATATGPTSPRAATPDTTATEAGSGGIQGTWTVDPAEASFAGYRVDEELANVGFATAVGRTPAITGAFTVDDGTVTGGRIEADLTQLTSDRSFRDNALRTQALETNRFPDAIFELAAPVALPEGADAGVPFQTLLGGELTLHGVTQRVELEVEAQLAGRTLVIVGQLDILFADYNIAQPSARAVLSVEDHGIMEFQLFFARR